MFFALGVLSNDTAQPITRGPVARKAIALTFDACQTKTKTGFDTKIIQVLKTSKCKATLFLGGAWAESHRIEAGRLGSEPLFEIAQHSYIHPHFPKLSSSSMRTDLARAQKAIRQLTGRTPRFFRPPYGEWNAATVRAAATSGLQTVLWSIVTGDPDKGVSSQSIVRTVLANAKPGAIVIMHMNGRGWHTGEALPQVIAGLRKKGFELVTLSELMGKS